MEKKKQDITDIFVKHRKLTLGVKLMGTFAITYYSIYFVLLTIFGIYSRSVYDPTYSEDTMFKSVMLLAILWVIVGMLVVSLILLFNRRRYGKFLFMIFTVILIVYQLLTAKDYVWAIYFLEFMMMMIMAPLKVFVTINKNINKKIKEEITDISRVEE